MSEPTSMPRIVAHKQQAGRQAVITLLLPPTGTPPIHTKGVSLELATLNPRETYIIRFAKDIYPTL